MTRLLSELDLPEIASENVRIPSDTPLKTNPYEMSLSQDKWKPGFTMKILIRLVNTIPSPFVCPKSGRGHV